MNTFIQKQVKEPKQVSFHTKHTGSKAHRTNALSALVHVSSVRGHAQRVYPLSHPGELMPRCEKCKPKYTLEAKRYGI